MKRSKLYGVFKLVLASLGLMSLIVTMTSSTALAHKVNIHAYVKGDTVFTESYFPDGKKIEGGTIEVYDSQGKKLLEGTTDKDGLFSFKIPKKDDLNIVLIATTGHKNAFLLKKEDM